MLTGGIATAIVLLLGALWIVLRRRWIASKRALRLTLENISQGIVMVDAGGHVPVINRRALELLDLPPETLAVPPAARPGAAGAELPGPGRRGPLPGRRDRQAGR